MNHQLPVFFHNIVAAQALNCSYVNTAISSFEGHPSAPKMAFNALLVVEILSSMAFAMISPCLQHMDPEFCPSTAATAGAAAVPKWPAESVIYPSQMHQEVVLRDRIFPRIDKRRMIANTKLVATRDNNFPQYFSQSPLQVQVWRSCQAVDWVSSLWCDVRRTYLT